jgi:hypothetical protein
MKKMIPYIIIIYGLWTTSSCGPKGARVPDMELRQLDSVSYIKTSELGNGRPFAIIFYFSDCEGCQAETAELVKAIDLVKSFDIYYVSIEPFADVKFFSKYYGLAKYDNIHVLQDYKIEFPKYFHPTVTPYIVLYNGKRELQMVFVGKTKVDVLAKSLKSIKG